MRIKTNCPLSQIKPCALKIYKRENEGTHATATAVEATSNKEQAGTASYSRAPQESGVSLKECRTSVMLCSK